MKTVVVVAGFCLLAVAGSAGVAGAQTVRPSLAVIDTRPFEVRGAGFEPRERVTVLLALNGSQRWQRGVASSSGVFTVEFPASLGACSRFTIQAFGSKGSRARVVPRHLPDCVPPA